MGCDQHGTLKPFWCPQPQLIENKKWAKHGFAQRGKAKQRPRLVCYFFFFNLMFLHAFDTLVMGSTWVPKEADHQNLVLQAWWAVLEEKYLGRRNFTAKKMKSTAQDEASLTCFPSTWANLSSSSASTTICSPSIPLLCLKQMSLNVYIPSPLLNLILWWQLFFFFCSIQTYVRLLLYYVNSAPFHCVQ